MTTNEHPANRVILSGLLDPRRYRNQEVAATSRRDLRGGRITQFTLQVDSPFGDPFAAAITTGHTSHGVEIINEAHINQPIYVEAVLRATLNIDPRYAIADDDIGRVSRTMELRATTIRPLQEGEPCGTSAVWLDGVVMSDARFGTHRSAMAVELARIVMRVRWPGHSAAFGSRAIIYEEADINVSVPVALEGVAYALKPGNRIAIVGQLDSVLVPTRGGQVDGRLEQLANEWQQRKATLTSDNARRTELNTYRRMVQRLSQAPMLAVLAGTITPAEGASLGDLEQARATDRARRQRTQPAATELESVAPEDNDATVPRRPRRRAVDVVETLPEVNGIVADG